MCMLHRWSHPTESHTKPFHHGSKFASLTKQQIVIIDLPFDVNAVVAAKIAVRQVAATAYLRPIATMVALNFFMLPKWEKDLMRRMYVQWWGSCNSQASKLGERLSCVLRYVLELERAYMAFPIELTRWLLCSFLHSRWPMTSSLTSREQ